ncbi:MAG: alpha/beta fold hydrolase [Alphaproteobacteria bacterium]|nr:alpha/beta fold hydrolase [Alphaproteobacteria bacterium]
MLILAIIVRFSRLGLTVLAATCLLPLAVDPVAAKPGRAAMATVPARHMQFEAGTLLDYKRMRLPAFYRAKAWRILYVTRDYRLRPVFSTGMVVLPDRAPKIPMERAFVAWAHPTTGIARKCAPSLRQSPIKAIEGLNELVASGVVVTASDYPGLGTEGPIGYLVGKGQAYAVIDSVRAARQIPGVGGSSNYALWGFSQGGHAALFAADEASTYAPELSLRAAAVVAPPTDLARLLKADLHSVEGRVLAAMTLASWSRKYDVSLRPLVDDSVMDVIDDVNSNCVDDLGSKLDVLAAQKPLSRRFLNFDPTSRRPWSDLLMENSKFVLRSKVPLFVAQGTTDALVRPEVTLQFIRNSCRQGVPIRYAPVKAKGHGASAAAAAPGAVAWLTSYLRGRPLPGNCR